MGLAKSPSAGINPPTNADSLLELNKVDENKKDEEESKELQGSREAAPEQEPG